MSNNEWLVLNLVILIWGALGWVLYLVRGRFFSGDRQQEEQNQLQAIQAVVRDAVRESLAPPAETAEAAGAEESKGE